MADRNPNTLHIEITCTPGQRGAVGLALRSAANAFNNGALGNAKVLTNYDGDEIGMACMVYREPGSHGGQG